MVDALERHPFLDIAEILFPAVQGVLLAHCAEAPLRFLAFEQGLGLVVGQFVVAEGQRAAQDVEPAVGSQLS